MNGTAIRPIELGPITREQLRAYADASGDHNPIHLDAEVAAAKGLPGIIAHGMLSAAFIGERALQAIEELAYDRRYRLARLHTRFKAMVVLGDRISIGGTVKAVGGDKLILDFFAKNQRGETVTIGTAEFRIA